MGWGYFPLLASAFLARAPGAPVRSLATLGVSRCVLGDPVALLAWADSALPSVTAPPPSLLGRSARAPGGLLLFFSSLRGVVGEDARCIGGLVKVAARKKKFGMGKQS